MSIVFCIDDNRIVVQMCSKKVLKVRHLFFAQNNESEIVIIKEYTGGIL